MKKERERERKLTKSQTCQEFFFFFLGETNTHRKKETCLELKLETETLNHSLYSPTSCGIWFFLFFFPYLIFVSTVFLRLVIVYWHRGFVWMPLITKNWKHCSKIIFKWVNSAVKPNFKEKFAEIRTCESHEQYMGPI